MTLRPLARAVALAGAAALSLGVLAAPSAGALPPTKRVVNDPVDPGKAFDIVQVVLRSAPAEGKRAVVVIKHAREETAGDSIDVWFNLDDDKEPDVHMVGDAGSEYHAFKTNSFTEDGKDITNKDCFRMSIGGKLTKVKFHPDCLGPSLKYGVSVRSSRFDEPATANDWVRAPRKFTKKVLSAPLS